MESIIKLRIILDATEDIFRDIEIDYDAPLMHLHLATLDAFEWNNANEMASFYKSNEQWDRGDEFPMMAMSPELPSMESATVKDFCLMHRAKGYMSMTTCACGAFTWNPWPSQRLKRRGRIQASLSNLGKPQIR